ncbi:hypothetical protein V5N11_032854 [Cardamine amara subsp. amara]|uniref:Uncharacterized protein n=1 Tax=Cardamine amara subsp. amara TaxID=228776 RepID=A0ABD0ZNR3_CARAN
MEIFQWFFKLAKEPEISKSCSFKCTDHEPTTTLTNRKARSSTRGSKHRNQRSYKGIWLWCRKDVSNACFYSTLTLRRLDSFKREHLLRSMAKMKKAQEGGEEEVTSTRFDPKKAIKVLEQEKQDETNKEKAKSEQSKSKATLSRMKELMRWAAAAKSDKALKFFTPKVMVELRNRRKLKMMNEKESKRMSSESARWESSESCTTISSSDHISIVSSPAILVSLGPTPLYRCRSKKGNWITTDSEFVVLEL